VILKRNAFGLDGKPTLGTMESGTFSCVTLERSQNGDHPCIPAGTYTVFKSVHHPDGPHPYACPELLNVAGRTKIHIHVANNAGQLLGCIAVGENVAGDSIEHSQAAFDRLMAFIGGGFPFSLTIQDPPSGHAKPAENQT